MLDRLSERSKRRLAAIALIGIGGVSAGACSSAYEPRTPDSLGSDGGESLGFMETEASGAVDDGVGGDDPSREEAGDDPSGGGGSSGAAGNEAEAEDEGGDDAGSEATGSRPNDEDEEDEYGDASGGTTDTGEGTTSTGEWNPWPGCPEMFPDGWLFCEDFEGGREPRDTFFEYQDGGGAFVLATDQAASGRHSMRATYMEGVEGAGWLSIAVGRTPEVFYSRPRSAPDLEITELYWRFRIRMQEGWPDLGPQKLTQAVGLSDSDFGHAFAAKIGSDGDGTVLRGEGSSCVFGEELPCRGLDGAASQQLLSFTGTTELFSGAYAGAWHCVEGHVKLNTLGELDGEFDFWVDDVHDQGVDMLDWRGSWDAYGINLVTIENFWSGGAPEALSRWIDDVVVSTEPIGCR